ncbi:hypothetical protein ABW21_db0200814 [Orbilia brochopaga]|nr:hypothetical protein ABW21_db0200814 [Drechslerella brochopaga]
MWANSMFVRTYGLLLISWIAIAIASPLSGEIDKRQGCSRDNCLRGLIDGRWSSIGLAFCESIISYDPDPETVSTIYTTPVVTTTVSVPNPVALSTDQTITATPIVTYITEHTTITASDAVRRDVFTRAPLWRNTTKTTILYTSTRTITRTFDNRNVGAIKKRATTSTPAGLLKIISSCSSSRLSSACSCLAGEIPLATVTTHLPFPVASTVTEYATLEPATVTYTVHITSTVTNTLTQTDTISTVTDFFTISIPRNRTSTTVTIDRVSTITYTSCLSTPTTPANSNFDTVDGSWKVFGVNHRVTWTIDATNPHTPGGRSGHIHFDQAGNYQFRLTAPIPQLCPSHSYRVSIWAASNMHGSPGQCNICVRLGASWESCGRGAPGMIQSTWTQWTREIVFPASGPKPRIEIIVGCQIGGPFPFLRDVDIWVDDFSIEDLELFAIGRRWLPPIEIQPYSPLFESHEF